MGFAETMIFYLLIGVGVAIGGLPVGLRAEAAGRRRSGWRRPSSSGRCTCRSCWRDRGPNRCRKPPPVTSDGDAMSQAIAQVEAELETGAGESRRLGRGRPGSRDRPPPRAEHRLASPGRHGFVRWTACSPGRSRRTRARCPRSRDWRRATAAARASSRVGANLARLRQVRGRAYDDLMGTLAWVRELVSMIHLAKFTGAPASRAEELVAQIAAAIEGISAVTWQDAQPESTVRPLRPASSSTQFPRGDCSMRLFRRIGDIVAANLNDLVDRFEDPEVMLKQAIREMETMIEEATGAAARAIAGERLLARDLSDHERKARRWNARAEEAVRTRR